MVLTVEEATRDWPKDPKESAKRLVQTYGQPDEITESRLIWHRTHDGWKRTVLSREETPHDFPAHHTDYLEQFIDYKVPIEMYSKLDRVRWQRHRGEDEGRALGALRRNLDELRRHQLGA